MSEDPFYAKLFDFGGALTNLKHTSIGGVGDGDADDGDALDTAGSNAGVSTVLIPAGTYSIEHNLTFSKALRIEQGAVLKPALNVTVTLAGPVSAGPYRWIDTSANGKVTFAQGSVAGLDPRWWGTVADGAASDSAALQAAANVAKVTGIPIDLCDGLWLVTSYIDLSGATADITIRGRGPYVTRVKRADGAITGDNQPIFYIGNLEGTPIRLDISGIWLNGNLTGNPFPGGDAALWQHCHDILVSPRGARGISEVRLRDLTHDDPVADGIGLGGSSGRTYGDVFIQGIREINRNRRLRSGIIFTGAFDRAVVDDVIVDNLEVELNAYEPLSPCILMLANAELRYKLDVNFKQSQYPYEPWLPVLHLNNVHVDGRVNLGHASVRAINCSFTVPERVRLVAGEYRFVNTRFCAREDFDIVPGNMLVTWTNSDPLNPDPELRSFTTPEVVDFLLCEFDSRATTALSWYVSQPPSLGSLRREWSYRSCVFRGTIPAIQYRGGVLTVEDCDFHAASPDGVVYMGPLDNAFSNRCFLRNNRVHADGYLFRVSALVGDTAAVWMRGNVNTVSKFKLLNARETNTVERGDVAAGSAGITYHELDDYTSAAAPASGRWLRGTRVFYPSPTPGGYLGLVCTTAGTSPVWKQFGPVAA